VTLCVVVVVLAALCAGCGGSGSAIKQQQSLYRGADLSPAITAPGFALRDQAGHEVSLAARRGHWVLVTFLYTHCPDVCPVIAGNLNRVLKAQVARRIGLSVLAVSVDPKRDTATAVKRYVHEHRLVPAFRYLIGTRAQLAPVWHKYHVAVLAGTKKTVTHNAVTFLVDPQGKERLEYPGEVLTGDVLHDLGLLRQG
jgi:protein SCO1/2